MRTVIEVAEAVRAGELKASEVLDECLDAVATHNADLNAFVHLDAEAARTAAQAVDEAVARGDDPGPLAGVPFGVKDLEDCAGMPTSHGSILYKGRPPVPEDSVNVSRLRGAGYQCRESRGELAAAQTAAFEVVEQLFDYELHGCSFQKNAISYPELANAATW